MTDEELIAGLRENALWVTTHQAADRIEALRAALDEAEARAVKAEAALKDIDVNLTSFLERKPQQMMLPETVEFVRDMSRTHLGAKP